MRLNCEGYIHYANRSHTQKISLRHTQKVTLGLEKVLYCKNQFEFQRKRSEY